VVTVSVEPGTAGAAVVVAAAGPMEPWSPEEGRLASLQGLVEVLGADLTWDGDRGRIFLELHEVQDMG